MTNSDHIGEALLAHLAGETRGLMIRRSDGEVFEDRSFERWLAPFPSADPAEQKLLSLIGPPVLELEAGAGRVSLGLRERGIRALPADPSPGCVEALHRRGLDSARMALGGEDLRGMRFNTLLLLRGGLPVFGTLERTRLWLAGLLDVTEPGGMLFVGSVLGGWSRDAYRHPDPELAGFEMAVRSRSERGAEVGPWADRLFPGAQEFVELLDGTGWEPTGETILFAGGPALILSARKGTE